MNDPIDIPDDQLSPSPDFTLDFRCDTIRQLHKYWNRKRGDRAMPRRADIDPVEIPRLLPYVSLIGVEHEPFRLFYRLIGTHITQAVGRDSTGRYFDEIYEGKILDDMARRFSTVVKAKTPARFMARAFFAGKDYRHYETVHLPLSDDGQTVNMIFAGVQFIR